MLEFSLQINLFVERHHTLYKSQDILNWLVDGVKMAHDCVLKRSMFQGVTVEDWTCVRTAAFPPDDQNHFGYIHHSYRYPITRCCVLQSSASVRFLG